jgi:hypothetical protein
MLREKPEGRPNVYQVLREACQLQGIEVPIKDVRYTDHFRRPPLIRSDIRWENRLTYETEPVITQPELTCISYRRRSLLTTSPAKGSDSRCGTNAPRAANYNASGPWSKANSVSYARGKRRPICCFRRKVVSSD